MAVNLKKFQSNTILYKKTQNDTYTKAYFFYDD